MKHGFIQSSIAALFVVATLVSCGGKNDGDFIKSAKSHLEKGDLKAANIELKAALQKNPKSGEARYLLGKTLLASGDVVAATVELQKAAELKYDVSVVVPLLARSMHEHGDNKQVVEAYDKFTVPDPTSQAELKTTLAAAHARLGSREAASAALAEALKISPKLSPALILKARMTADQKDMPGAHAILDELIAREPKNHEAWLLKGDLNVYGGGDKAQALIAYRKALEFKPSLIVAHTNIVEILLGQKDTEGAKVQVAAMKKNLPNHPQTLYFEGVLAYLAKDYTAARPLAARVVQLAPTNALGLQLAGSVEFQLRAYQQAETYLIAALQQAPGLPLARLLLAQSQLRSGQPTKALATLAPAIESPKASAELLAVAAEAHLQNGDSQKSEALYARAMKAKPDDTKIRAAHALGQVRRGESVPAAMGELETIAAADTGSIANMALISAHLRRNELDQALKAIDALEKKQPKSPIATNLRGRVQVLRKDNVNARINFEKSLALDAGYFPALASLAALDMVEKKPEAAKERFEAFVKANPKSVSALLGLASVMQRTSANKDKVVEIYSRAIKAEPSQAGPRLKLTEYLLGLKDFKGALAAAQDGVAAIPNNAELLQASGTVHASSGDYQQAITALTKVVAQRPEAPSAWIALGDAYALKKDNVESAKSYRKALEIRADALPAQRGLISIAMADRKFPEALEIARKVQKQRAGDGIGQMLEGDIEVGRKNMDAAAAAYRVSLQKSPTSTEVAVRLHKVLLSSGKTADADRFAASWEKERPRDGAFLFHMGDMALFSRNMPLAETRYRAVLAVQPQNALALNNVAWLLAQQGKPGGAAMAEQAVQLLPNQPALLDTLASALAAEKKYPQALEAIKRATALAPKDNSLRMTLARVLVESGDKAAARLELQYLEKLGPAYPEQEKVKALLATVNS